MYESAMQAFSAGEKQAVGLFCVRFVQRSEHSVRFYFHIRDQNRVIPDEEGSELSGIAAARHEARASAMDFAMDDLRSGRMIDDRQIEIVNEAGTILESVTVRDAILSRGH